MAARRRPPEAQREGARPATAAPPLTLLPEGRDVRTVFKWMYCPDDGVVLVGSPAGEYHADLLRSARTDRPQLAEFERWIRFIHLSPSDFVGDKAGRVRPLLCVRAYEATAFPALTEDALRALVAHVGIKSAIRFGITNEKLADLTGDYGRAW